MQKQKVTPLMQQYFQLKEQYPEMLLLFQVGDFYELFFDDAKQAAAYLGIALTKRGTHDGMPIPLCGVPVHALQHYLLKLARGGFKIAICDQLEAAVPGKVVERGVTQVLTPGTLTDMQLLDAHAASYLCSFFPMQDAWGLLFGEILTAQLVGTVIPADQMKRVEAEIARFMPDEIVLPHTDAGKSFVSTFKKMGYYTSLEHGVHDEKQQRSFKTWVKEQLNAATGSMLNKEYALNAAMQSFYCYLNKNNASALQQFRQVQWYAPDEFLLLDAATQRNLELVKNRHDGTRKGTLFAVLDQAVTPMGSRMVRKWLTRPLVHKDQIVARQDVVRLFVQQVALVQELEPLLKQLGDLERVVGRIALGRAQLHDYLVLKRALGILPAITSAMKKYQHEALLQTICAYIIDFAALHQLLRASLYEDGERDWLIKPSFDQELDHLRQLVEQSNESILALERAEQEHTGIASLKIRYNNVHGYYIEVTKTHMASVPERYVRQQTLVNRERYMTPELQQLQAEIRHAQENIQAVEKTIYERIKAEVAQSVTPLRKLSHALAHLDALFGFARAASMYDYICPELNEQRLVEIKGGRHPVVQALCSNQFIPNDTQLDDEHALWVITGPNMGGKSTYLRQVALMSIMAQVGSFVPADSANIAIMDRIFTRIGSGDHLTEGKSTFLVEMEETATICSQATNRSLVILDEVGRGTSTFDGLAIAQAVIEYIYTHVQARCLFATHYHELTQLHQTFPGIVSYYAASQKTAHGITFLYKIKQGVADGSFGVQVAKLADIPPTVIARAQEILQALAVHEDDLGQRLHAVSTSSTELSDAYMRLQDQHKQLQEAYDLLKKEHAHAHALAKTMQEVDINDISPKKAFDILWSLKNQ